MLNSRLGVLFYLILPNHWVWKMLSGKEKEIIFSACKTHNNIQYKKPQDYDQNHSRGISVNETRESEIINYSLNKYSPKSVLEVGPGNGFFTKLFLDYPSVKEYTAIDIVKPFIDYIDNNVVGSYRNRINIDLINSDLLNYDFKNKKVDLIVFLSSLHHIPNRIDIFKKCETLLSERGSIMFIEPRHGILRIYRLFVKYIRYYNKKSYWLKRSNLSTHHFLTSSEIKSIAKKCNFKIAEIISFSYRGNKYLKRIFKSKFSFFSSCKLPLLPLFASQVFVQYKKGK